MKKQSGIVIGAGVVIVLLLCVVAAIVSFVIGTKYLREQEIASRQRYQEHLDRLQNDNLSSPTPMAKKQSPTSADVTELQIEDLKKGNGDAAKTGDTVTVHYRGTLTNGEEFDASYNRNEPFSFTVGQGRVIQGWDEGLIGMKVGGKRKLTVPYAMAYGENGMPPVIPPKATLVFEIELLEIN